MSIKCQTRVWESSRAKGSALLLLLAIAEHAHDDGSGAWPSQDRLAKRTRMSVRQVRRLMEVLEQSGELAITRRPGTTDLLSVVVNGADNLSGVDVAESGQNVRPTPDTATSDHPGHLGATPDTAMSYEPSLDPSSIRPGTVSSEDGAAAPTSRNVEDAGVRRGARKVADRLVASVDGPYRDHRARLLPQVDRLLGLGWPEAWVENGLRLASTLRHPADQFAEYFLAVNGEVPQQDDVAF